MALKTLKMPKKPLRKLIMPEKPPEKVEKSQKNTTGTLVGLITTILGSLTTENAVIGSIQWKRRCHLRLYLRR